MKPPPTVSIIATPRERFGLAEMSLRSLFAATPEDFELIYVDAGSPRRVARLLDRMARERGFTLLRSRAYLSPNRARNLGLQHATGTYVVFVDNDVEFSPGWLTALLDCATAEQAWLVGPLYLEGKLDPHGDYSPNRIHMAAGDMRFSGEWGQREFVQTQRHFGKRLDELSDADLTRQRCDIVEFHCALVRRDAFEKAGTMDEELLTTREHLDFCQRVIDAGGSVYFEPRSVISYHTPPPVSLRDLPYFALRWSDTWSRKTLIHFAKRYGITPSYIDRIAKNRWIRQWVITESLAAGKPYRPLVVGLVKLLDPLLNRAVAAVAGRRPSDSAEVVWTGRKLADGAGA